MKLPYLVLVLTFLLWPVVLSAQIIPEPPPRVRFTGSFLPPNEKRTAELSTLRVSIRTTKWRFRIAKVEKLTGRDPSGTRLLESIFPPYLRFTGPEHLLSMLQDPQIEGQPFTIEGHLYVGERLFFVTIVNPLPLE